MGESIEHCQYYYPDMAQATLPDTRLALPLRRHWWGLKTWMWYMSILGPRKFASKIISTTRVARFALKKQKKLREIGRTGEALSLRPGDWVEVRSAKEIFSTLDGQGKNRGLTFTREMQRFCGKRFRVYKRLGKIIMEATGELRQIATPTVLLEEFSAMGKLMEDAIDHVSVFGEKFG